ncbi:MAG: polysaccharide biosynthesis C-terminal domain-containing protein [Muribaculaceae bacterium]
MSVQPTTGRSGKLLKDIGIYAIGNLGSKLVTFMLVPLYTFYICPAEFGYYDICLTAIFMLMPFLSLQLRDGAFRFLVDADNVFRKRAIVTFVYKTLFRNSIVCILIGAFIYIFSSVQYLWLLVVLLIVMSAYEVIIQVVRGLGNTKYFVVAGIVSSLFIGVFSILFVVIFKLGIEGVFYANILARFITILFLELRLKVIKKYFGYNFNDSKTNKEILSYCLPLLPGAICWWLVGSSNKFFIEHYLGLDENGLYAVALKFTSILETIAFIFYQAWQETAIRQYSSPDRNRFFSSIINNYLFVLIACVILFSFALKLNYGWLVEHEYQLSVNYIYPLAVSAMFFSLSAFYDMGYQCSKKTIYTLPGIVLASIVNIIGNYFLIQILGVYGIILSSILTFVTLFVYRVFDTRKFFKISFSNAIIAPIILLIISGFAYYYIQSIQVNIIYFVIVLIALSIFAPVDVKQMIKNKILRR